MTKRWSKRHFLTLLRAVEREAAAQARAHDGSKYGAGLASEGYAGGYLAALRDVEAAMTHGYPTDTWGFWLRAKSASADKPVAKS